MGIEYYVGIDIGSTCAKTVVLSRDGGILHRMLLPTGWSSVDTAALIRKELAAGGYPEDQCLAVSTGYGREAVSFAAKKITEITCHARGACHIHQTQDLTVIDIGGQDTKLIAVEHGQVTDFLMNDKCSAGTGRFLEVMANTLCVTPKELCTLARQGGGASISSMCTVFAESEVIGLIGKGEKRENIAFAVVDSIVKKVASQAGRLKLDQKVCLTGGLCEFDYLRERLGQVLHCEVCASPDGRYAGAAGAALFALHLGGGDPVCVPEMRREDRDE